MDLLLQHQGIKTYGQLRIRQQPLKLKWAQQVPPKLSPDIQRWRL